MTVLLSYDSGLSRVQVTADATPLNTVTVNIERSIDAGVNYTMVRGGEGVPHTPAEDPHLVADDYEFMPDVSNRYRIQFFNAAGALLAGQFADITPSLDGQVWLKSVQRPFLNVPIRIADYSEIEQPSRDGSFEIVGRSFPIDVADVHGSQRYTLDVNTTTSQEESELRALVTCGDMLFLQVPGDGSCEALPPTMYARPGNLTRRRMGRRDRRVFSLPLTEYAAPDASIVGATGTYATVLNTFATYAALLAAEPTYASLSQIVGSFRDVVVP